MHKHQEVVPLSSHDNLSVRSYTKHGDDGDWVEIAVWSDYDCRGGTIALYTGAELDQLIQVLTEMRKGVL